MKNLNCEPDKPVQFNCWKHHAGFLKAKITEYHEAGNFDFSSFRNNLMRIGDSLMDLYLGKLSPNEITGTIINIFQKKNITNRDDFIFWLKENGNDYRVIEIDDQSKWTVLLGEQMERYIHIHPSRYSYYTTRIRAITLKSAILFLILCRENCKIEDNLLFLNKIRKDYLNQPPLKSISKKSALPALISVLKDR